MVSPKLFFTLAQYRGDTFLRRDVLCAERILLGKDPRHPLPLAEENADLLHAVLVSSSKALQLVALSSDKPTFLNGDPIQVASLSCGDRIQIGSVTLVLEKSEERAEEPSLRPDAVPVPPPPSSWAAPSPPRLVSGASPVATSHRPQEASYQPVQSAQDVPRTDTESADKISAEVMLLWGDQVLEVVHVGPSRSLYVGDPAYSAEKKSPLGKVACGFWMPAATLGAPRVQLIKRAFGSVVVTFPPTAKGWIETAEKGRIWVHSEAAHGRVNPSTELPGAYEATLPLGGKAWIELDKGLVFVVRTVHAGKVPSVAWWKHWDTSLLGVGALSLLLHVGLLSAFAWLLRMAPVDQGHANDREQIESLQKLLNAADTRAQETKPLASSDKGGGGKGRPGGSASRPQSKQAAQSPSPAGAGGGSASARQGMMQEAASFGMIGLLDLGAGASSGAAPSPWGNTPVAGAGSAAAASMWAGGGGGEGLAVGGIGLSGAGQGGGGTGAGVGLGGIGTVGQGTGTGSGFGAGHGRIGGTHQTRAPSLRQGEVKVSGRIPPEVIQRIVRQNFGRFRLCYEDGLRAHPDLQGRVAIQFVIDRSGSVMAASNGGSDLPNADVIACIARGFRSLSFPPPEGGIVTIVYPILFTP